MATAAEQVQGLPAPAPSSSSPSRESSQNHPENYDGLDVGWTQTFWSNHSDLFQTQVFPLSSQLPLGQTNSQQITPLFSDEPPSFQLLSEDFWNVDGPPTTSQDSQDADRDFRTTTGLLKPDGNENTGELETAAIIATNISACMSLKDTVPPNDASSLKPPTSLFGGLPGVIQDQSAHSRSVTVPSVSGESGDTGFANHSFEHQATSTWTPERQRLCASREHSQDVHAAEVDCSDDDSKGTRYEFRPAVREKILTCGSTWLDKDESGTYDPTKDGKSIAPPLPKRKRIATNQNNEQEAIDNEPVPKRSKSLKSARMNGLVCIVTLKFESPRGLRLLSKIPDNIPLGYDEPWNFLLDENQSSSDASLSWTGKPSYHLRSRPSQLRGDSDCSSMTVPYGVIQFDQGISLSGQPAARGCKACRNLRQVCPMLEPNGTYPCYLCIEDGCDCELVVPPIKKRSCEHCKKRRVRCSYRDDQDHSGPCTGCQAFGYHCIAGPAIDRTRTRIGHDGKPATNYEREPEYKRPTQVKESKLEPSTRPQMRYLTCEACRGSGRHCSIQASNPILPCANCVPRGENCRLRSVTPLSLGKKQIQGGEIDMTETLPSNIVLDTGSAQLSNTSANAPMKLLAAPPPLKSSVFADICSQEEFVFRSKLMPTTKVTENGITTIRTRLVHPLTFNYSLGSRSCHWCIDPLYGLFGTGHAVQVKVQIRPDGKAYQEMTRKHTPGVLEPSNMCCRCTSERVKVLTCNEHTLRRIDGLSEEPERWERTLDALADSPPSSQGPQRKRILTRFCAICPKLAAYACFQRVNLGDEDSGRSAGCGLRLCKSCARHFLQRFNCDLQEMVSRLAIDNASMDDPRMFPLGLRADYDFFGRKSWLVKQVIDD